VTQPAERSELQTDPQVSPPPVLDESVTVLPSMGSKMGEDSPSYDASAIQVLEGLEAVRKRPGMYIGSTGERGLHHLVTEVVNNSVDEALAGYCDRIEITILADGGVRVRDNGRGIPVGIVESEGRPAVEVVLTVLHAGGKFGGGGYKVSGGLHGVGVSVVNALSSKLEVAVRTEGHLWTQSYTYGVPDAPLAMGEEVDDTGTEITFWADGEIFETTNYSFETMSTRLQEMAFLNKGLTIVLTDERPASTKRAKPTSSTRRRRPRSSTAMTVASSTTSTTSVRARTPYTARLSRSKQSRSTSTAACRSTWRCSGTPASPSRCTHSPTPSTPTRGARTKRASVRRSPR
jgi:DNA gyrase subunit B